jgi:hypothetical protein
VTARKLFQTDSEFARDRERYRRFDDMPEGSNTLNERPQTLTSPGSNN